MVLANSRINATVRMVTPLACASVAPIRPARYARRYTDTGTMNDQRPCPRLLVGPATPLGRSQTRTTISASVSRCHARRPVFTQASRNLNTLALRNAARHWHVLAALEAEHHVEDFPYNHAVNASVRPVTPLAVASVAPVRPARYRERSAELRTTADRLRITGLLSFCCEGPRSDPHARARRVGLGNHGWEPPAIQAFVQARACHGQRWPG